MGRRGNYRPVELYSRNEAVELKDGRTATVVRDDAWKKEVRIRFADGAEETLPWDLVIYVPKPTIPLLQIDGWQMLGNHPSDVPKPKTGS